MISGRIGYVSRLSACEISIYGIAFTVIFFFSGNRLKGKTAWYSYTETLHSYFKSIENNSVDVMNKYILSKHRALSIEY